MKNQTSQTARKRVLITGCSSGFGLLTAVRAAQAGFEVVATLRNPAKSEAIERALANAGVHAIIDQLDVTVPRQILAIADKYSPIDVLVNNAGGLVSGSFVDLTEDEVRGVLETNYFGDVALTRAVVGSMIERRQGRIINVASLAGIIGYPFSSAYAASKHALIGYSQSIRVELAMFGIKVISVEPGYHQTPIMYFNANLSENFYDRQSPTFEYNRGFLRALTNGLLPWAGKAEPVADRIVRLMSLRHPKTRYVIGKDARMAMALQWLGLMGLVERVVVWRIQRGRELENMKDRARQANRRGRGDGVLDRPPADKAMCLSGPESPGPSQSDSRPDQVVRPLSPLLE